jgi:cyclic pyranopterin monophosphate synthase
MNESKRTERLTHVDETGSAHMVDVTAKSITVREAEARASVNVLPATFGLIRDNAVSKGDVLGAARIAGILAAKRTSDLIPLCHSLPLSGMDISFHLDQELSRIEILARATTAAQTGVEMEALTAVTVAALTIYDMCKAVDRGIVIGDVRLTYKSGGASGTYRSE